MSDIKKSERSESKLQTVHNAYKIRTAVTKLAENNFYFDLNKINDLNLYLDLNPDDKEIFNLFKKYVKEEEKLTKEYESKFGPLTLKGDVGMKYDWLCSPWPWDNKGGSMYV